MVVNPCKQIYQSQRFTFPNFAQNFLFTFCEKLLLIVTHFPTTLRRKIRKSIFHYIMRIQYIILRSISGDSVILRSFANDSSHLVEKVFSQKQAKRFWILDPVLFGQDVDWREKRPIADINFSQKFSFLE